MNIKLRVIILLLTVTIIIQQLLSVIFHKSVSVVLTIIAALGLIYLILTAEENIFKRIKIRNRKILSSDGEYKEQPEFRKIYYDIVGEKTKEYRKLKKEFWKVHADLLVYICLFIVAGEDDWGFRVIILVASALSCFSFYVSSTRRNMQRDKADFIKNFYNDFIKSFNENYVFTLGDKEKQKTILDLKYCFNKDSIFGYNVNGIVHGYLDDSVSIKILDIEDATFANFKEDNHSATNFSGIITISNSIVDVDGKLKITKNREIISDEEKKEKVLLDNTMFESIYNVFSPDRIFAMRILTPEIMELLIEFDKYSIEFDLIIVYNKIIIRFYEDNMFDFSFARRAFNRDDMFLIYCIMKFSEDLINTINKSLKGYIA